MRMTVTAHGNVESKPQQQVGYDEQAMRSLLLEGKTAAEELLREAARATETAKLANCTRLKCLAKLNEATDICAKATAAAKAAIESANRAEQMVLDMQDRLFEQYGVEVQSHDHTECNATESLHPTARPVEVKRTVARLLPLSKPVKRPLVEEAGPTTTMNKRVNLFEKVLPSSNVPTATAKPLQQEQRRSFSDRDGTALEGEYKNWLKILSRSQQRYYYFNVVSRESIWVHPSTLKSENTAPSQQPKSPVVGKPRMVLVPGGTWEAGLFCDERSKYRYFNAFTQQEFYSSQRTELVLPSVNARAAALAGKHARQQTLREVQAV